jgi:6-phospho-beta-glucosidase
VQVAIIGGGGFRVPLVHRALLRSGLPVQRVVLHDVSAGRLDVMRRVLVASPPAVEATTVLDDALRGADLVFCAVRVGGLDGRVRDERSALELGLIGQ